jgi:hypothetical protein
MKYGTFPKIFDIRYTAIAVYALLLMSITACTDTDSPLPDNVLPGRPVEVTLQLSATQETDATDSLVATRAVDDGDVAPYAQIKNVWVLQFNGLTDAATLTGVPSYISDYEVEANRVCALVSGTNQTVWFLANTFDTHLHWDASLTLGTLKTRYMPNTTEASLHGRGDATTTPDVGYPADADYHLILNGTWQGNITTDGSLTCTLIRNTARVDFLLKNTTTGDDAVTITSVQVRNAMAQSYFYTSYALPATFPTTFSTNPYLETTDYTPVTWESGTSVSDGYTRFRFYLPANMRGTRTGITQTKDKTEYHPALATYVVVKGVYQKDGQSVPVTYTIYPGANLITDFNLLPNHAYVCKLDINGYDSSGADPRVRTFGTRDFAAAGEERANCYILNPSPDGVRSFKIPIDRINVFWGGQGYQNIPVNTLGASEAWTAEILWRDFDGSDVSTAPNYFALTKASGVGADGASDGYFTIETGVAVDGNALVAVKKGTTILWSWHLWMTDYDPYAASISTSAAPAQITDVPGGVITRFSAAAQDGKYMVIMDRCLGQSKARPDQQPLYQYGRKDPFGYNQADGAALYTENLTATQSRINSVMNPTFRTNNSAGATADWLNTGEASDGEWDDPTLMGASYVDYRSKSLYDPCPPGWKIPRTRTNLGGRNYTYTSGIYRLFNIEGVCWTWVYEANCWLSSRGASNQYIINSSSFGNYTNTPANYARAALLGVIPERMKY